MIALLETSAAMRQRSGLLGIILRGLADLLPENGDLRDELLHESAALLGDCPALITAVLGRCLSGDVVLIAAADSLRLETDDLIALALAEAVEREALAPVAFRAIQGVDFGPYPSLGLLNRLLDRLGVMRPSAAIPAERAFALGLLSPKGDSVPLPERQFALADIVKLARGLLPGGKDLPETILPIELPESWQAAATSLAADIEGRPLAVILRDGEQDDRLGYATLLASALGRQAMRLPGRFMPGLGAALDLARWMPVECLATTAGQSSEAVTLKPYRGPRVIISGRDGRIDANRFDCVDVPLPAITADERRTAWKKALPTEPISDLLPSQRFGPSRIASIATRTKLDHGPPLGRLRRAMGAELRSDLEPHARLVPAEVDDDALAAEPALRRDLELLLARCRLRHRPASHAGCLRMPGVRALLSGPSGTGKTFACSWLATRLGLALFKLDLASVVSKYIGETEENLARLLDQAEAAESVLLLDEADSLFGARTETKDSADRHANNQTNYLLSRIECFDGIVLLTTNGRERIDSAFSRRLDQIIEVPLPAPKERRRIWRLNLSPDHELSAGEVNRLATMIDLAGGHLRNIAATADLVAAAEGRPIAMTDILIGVEQEYRKIGRSPPHGLNCK